MSLNPREGVGWVMTPPVLLTVLHQRGVTGSDFQVGQVVGKTLAPPGERGEGGDAVERTSKAPTLVLTPHRASAAPSSGLISVKIKVFPSCLCLTSSGSSWFQPCHCSLPPWWSEVFHPEITETSKCCPALARQNSSPEILTLWGNSFWCLAESAAVA